MGSGCFGWPTSIPPTGLAQLLRDRSEQRGRCWIFLDGFDEVSDRSIDRIHDEITKFANNHPDAALVVTSRPIGQRDIEGFGHGTVKPLEPGQQSTLLVNWLGGDAGAEAFAKIRGIPRLSELAGNPLTLTLLALLAHSRKAAFPERRVDLYDSIIDVLLDGEHKEDTESDPARRRMTEPTSARDLLGVLCLRLQTAEYDRQSWDKKDLVRTMRAVDQTDLPGVLTDYWSGPDAFLRELAQKAGLLGEYDGPGEGWRFLHRSIREFAAAEAMKSEASDALVARARALDEDTLPRWSETYAMLCALIPKPLELLKALVDECGALVRRASPETSSA